MSREEGRLQRGQRKLCRTLCVAGETGFYPREMGALEGQRAEEGWHLTRVFTGAL